jgi:hypothetical protein
MSESVRLATMSDYEDILKVSNSSDPKENSAWFPTSIREDIANGFVLYDPPTRGVLDFYPTKTEPFRVTVYNLMIPRASRRQGAGTRLMVELSKRYPTRPIIVKCPYGIPANEFYKAIGLKYDETLEPKGRRKVPLNLYHWDPLTMVVPEA